jgi:hypothetical protein
LSSSKSEAEKHESESDRGKSVRPNSTGEKSGINELKSDVDALSTEVQTAVVDLKRSIEDIRSSISEMENPFNLLKGLSNEKDLEEHNEQRLPSGVRSIILGKPEVPSSYMESYPPQAPQMIEPYPPASPPRMEPYPPQAPQMMESSPAPSPQKIEPPPPKFEPPPPKFEPLSPQIEVATEEKPNKPVEPPATLEQVKASAYIDWIWGLLDVGLTADNIRQLACSGELTGYLPARTTELIYSLAVTSEQIRLNGLTKEHLLLFFYKAAAISNININSDDMKTLITISEQQLKKPKSNRAEHQSKRPKKTILEHQSKKPKNTRGTR